MSSALCNIYLGQMVESHLGQFTSHHDNLLTRAVDDFLFATPSLETAKTFLQVMSDGFPEYGIKCHKFTTNFGEGKADLVFCGIRLVDDDRQRFCKLTPDVAAYMRQNIAYSVNFQSFLPSSRDDFLVKKTQFLPRIKMQSAFLDESINGRAQVHV